MLLVQQSSNLPQKNYYLSFGYDGKNYNALKVSNGKLEMNGQKIFIWYK